MTTQSQDDSDRLSRREWRYPIRESGGRPAVASGSGPGNPGRRPDGRERQRPLGTSNQFCPKTVLSRSVTLAAGLVRIFFSSSPST